MNKIFKKNDGFTLLELVIVVGTIIMIATVVGGILSSSLRSATKATVLTSVNQNGDYAINQIASNIKFAKAFGGVSNDDTTYITDCTTASGSYKYLKVTGFDNGTATYVCGDASAPPNIASRSAVGTMTLLDTNAVTIANNGATCSFTCTQNTFLDPPTIGISFSLQQRSNSTLIENVLAPVPFQTSVGMRNK